MDATLDAMSVTYHIQVTLTLTSELFCRIIVSRTYLIYYLRWESQIWCLDASWDDGVSCTVRVTVMLNLTFHLVFRIIISGAYLFYYLR